MYCRNMPLPVHIPRQHRLLPLLVGLIGVYNFYQVVLTLTGQTELFGRLKDMLLIQVLYLILIYIMDFLKIHIPYGVQWIMFCVLLALNVIVFMLLPAAGNLSHLFQNLLNRMYGGDRCNGDLRLSAPFPDHAWSIRLLICSILCCS